MPVVVEPVEVNLILLIVSSPAPLLELQVAFSQRPLVYELEVPMLTFTPPATVPVVQVSVVHLVLTAKVKWGEPKYANAITKKTPMKRINLIGLIDLINLNCGLVSVDKLFSRIKISVW